MYLLFARSPHIFFVCRRFSREFIWKRAPYTFSKCFILVLLCQSNYFSTIMQYPVLLNKPPSKYRFKISNDLKKLHFQLEHQKENIFLNGIDENSFYEWKIAYLYIKISPFYAQHPQKHEKLCRIYLLFGLFCSLVLRILRWISKWCLLNAYNTAYSQKTVLIIVEVIRNYYFASTCCETLSWAFQLV